MKKTENINDMTICPLIESHKRSEYIVIDVLEVIKTTD